MHKTKLDNKSLKYSEAVRRRKADKSCNEQNMTMNIIDGINSEDDGDLFGTDGPLGLWSY